MTATAAIPLTPKQVENLFTALPPHSLEAESALLGSILVQPTVIDDIVQVIRGADDFFRAAHGTIYEAMIELYDAHGAMDIVQLNELLADRGTLQTVGGQGYLVDLANAVPSAANALHYARLVRDKSLTRSILELAGEMLRDAHQNTDEPRQVLERAEQALFGLAHQSEQNAAVHIPSLFGQVIEDLGPTSAWLNRVPTGLTDLDDITGGLRAGDLIIVAARPSMGKTALALTAAQNMAADGTPVGMFSMEMSASSLAQRLLSAQSGVSSSVMQALALSVGDFERLHEAAGSIMHEPFYVDDSAALTPLRLRAKARRLVAQRGVRCIFIDYLQLMSLGRRVESRQIEVSELSRQIKALARELNVPVVCLSQLNRGAEYREGHRPRLSDLRDSGSIEQDADVVLLLHRESYYHKGDSAWAQHNADKLNTAELIVAKHRNGPTGTITLNWHASTMRFRDHTGIEPGLI